NKKAELAKTEDLIGAADFWNQPERSQKIMQDRKRLEEALDHERHVATMTSDLDTLFELAREGEDVAIDIERDLKTYSSHLEKLEEGMLLAGDNDAMSAILTIHPGAG